MDKEPGELNNLSRKAKHLNLNNIKIIPTNSGVTLDFKSESIDVVLLYDVLHYLEKREREKLYRETYRVLKGNGFLSVYPKHVIEDSPLNHFRDLHRNEVKEEIQGLDFKFQEKYCDTMSHDDSLNYGCIISFGALTGILIIFVSLRMPRNISYNIFYVLHPTNVVLSALVTASIYKLHTCGRLIKSVLKDSATSGFSCCLSDIVFPLLFVRERQSNPSQ